LKKKETIQMFKW